MDSIVGLDEIVASQVIDLVDCTEQDWHRSGVGTRDVADA